MRKHHVVVAEGGKWLSMTLLAKNDSRHDLLIFVDVIKVTDVSTVRPYLGVS